MITKTQINQVRKTIETLNNLVLSETVKIKCKNVACPHYTEYESLNHCKKYRSFTAMLVNCQAVMPWTVYEMIGYLSDGRKKNKS